VHWTTWPVLYLILAEAGADDVPRNVASRAPGTTGSVVFSRDIVIGEQNQRNTGVVFSPAMRGFERDIAVVGLGTPDGWVAWLHALLRELFANSKSTSAAISKAMSGHNEC